MRFSAAFLFLIFALSPARLLAGDEDEAKDHYLKGKALVEEQAYEQAIVELEASYELSPVPIVLYNMAVCYDKLHQYADAVKYYRMFLSKGKDAPEELREKVSSRIKELNELIGLLKLEVDVEKAEVLVDGKLVGYSPVGSVFVETGSHDLVIRKTGYPDIKRKFKIVSGETTELSFSMKKPEEEGKETPEVEEKKKEPAGETSAKGRRKLPAAAFWSAVGVTGASALAMIITGSLALKKDKEVAGMYDDEDWKSVADERDSLALGTNILLGVAAAGATASLVLFFFTDFKKERRGSFLLGPGGSGESFAVGYRREF